MSSFLPEDFIEEVRVANEITDVISEYISLKPKGRNFFGLCPFHNEKTPSFSVDPQKQLYHCFGCGEGGNVFSFVMAQERLDFVDSVKLLAERKGIPLPGSLDRTQDEEARKHREELYKLNREAAMFYYQSLLSPEGKHALKYLKSRGINHRTIKAFGLGYAPNSWDSTMKHLLDKGFEKQLLIEIGLLVDKSQRTYDRFRNRVMFPIIDHRNRLVGFGGRVMDESVPKYLNSSESPVFNKSSILFGLNLARKQRPIDNLIVVEGYLDVISLYEFGLKNAVASLGTALTMDQAKLMRRYTPNIYIAYDGDTAGQKATARSLDILKDAGCNVRVIKLPKGKDPDDILRKHGVEYFNKLKEDAVSLINFKLDQLQSGYDLDSQEDKVEFATKAAHILIEVENPLERDIYVQKLNATTGFKPELLYRLMGQLEKPTDRTGLKKNLVGNNRYTTSVKKVRLQTPANLKAEKHLIGLMGESQEMAKKIIDQLEKGDFEDPVHGKVAGIVKELLDRDIEPKPAQILNYIKDDHERDKVIEIFRLEMEYDNVDRFIKDCVEELRRYRLEKRSNYLKEQISKMDREGNSGSTKYWELIEELQDINRRNKLGDIGKEEVM
ncbi:MAG: DNA primase [Clostridiales bacterium]|nr:DNA primase [Clostridiales bacterium]